MQVTDAMVEAAAKALAEAEATHDRKELWINHAARCCLTAALVDVQAGEPVAHIIEGPNGEDPRVYLTQKYDPRSPDFWLNEEARAKHRVTPLYASPPLSREGEDSAEVEKLRRESEILRGVFNDVLDWAERRCPCHNEEPNPCPLCGASVENLEACKSAENTLPRGLLIDLRIARSLIAASATTVKGAADHG